MFIDQLLDYIFGALEWLMGLLPAMPSFPILPPAFTEWLVMGDLFFDYGIIGGAIKICLTIAGGVLAFKFANWIINKVRGSG